jgi:hypothetical protein
LLEALTMEVFPALKLLDEDELPEDELLPQAEMVVARATAPPTTASRLRFRMIW